MDTPTMNRGYWERKGLLELGAIEVPGSAAKALTWEDISKDSLPIFVYRTSAPKALIAANRFQLEELKKMDNDVVRDLYILEIEKMRKHSNLDYCIDMVEMDRKVGKRRRTKKILGDTQKLLMTDIVKHLNRAKTAGDLAAAYNTSVTNVNLMAAKLRKEYHFKIPGARGFSDFDSIATQLAAENSDLIMQPAAPKTHTEFTHRRGVKTAVVNGR